MVVIVVATTVIMVVIATVVMTVGAWAAMAVVLGMVVVLRHIDVVVPAVLNEVDLTTAGIVLRAVTAPVALVARLHVEVYGRLAHILRVLLHHHGLLVDHRRGRRVAQIDLAIEAGLANIDGNTDIGHGYGGRCAEGGRRCES